MPSPTHDQLRAGAEWAVDVALSLPNSALTLVGVLLLPLSGPLLAVTCLIVLVVIVGFTLRVASAQRLTARGGRLREWMPTSLGWAQLVLNLAGLGLALLI